MINKFSRASNRSAKEVLTMETMVLAYPKTTQKSSLNIEIESNWRASRTKCNAHPNHLMKNTFGLTQSASRLRSFITI